MWRLSDARGNDLATTGEDAGINGLLAAGGEGIGSVIMKGLGTYAKNGAAVSKAENAAKTALKEADSYKDIAGLSDAEIASYKPGISPEKIAEVKAKAATAAANQELTANAAKTARQATVDDIKKGPIANLAGYGGIGAINVS